MAERYTGGSIELRSTTGRRRGRWIWQDECCGDMLIFEDAQAGGGGNAGDAQRLDLERAAYAMMTKRKTTIRRKTKCRRSLPELSTRTTSTDRVQPNRYKSTRQATANPRQEKRPTRTSGAAVSV